MSKISVITTENQKNRSYYLFFVRIKLIWKEGNHVYHLHPYQWDLAVLVLSQGEDRFLPDEVSVDLHPHLSHLL